MERNLKKSFVYSIVLFGVVIVGLTFFANYYTPRPESVSSTELTIDQKANIEKVMNQGARPVTTMSDEEKKNIEKEMNGNRTEPVTSLTDAEKEKIQNNFR